MKSTSETTLRGLPAYCVAAMLFTPSPLAAINATEQPFLKRYEPETNIDNVAALDLDQRSIVARLASGTEEGLRDAQDVYSKGRNHIPGSQIDYTLQSLSLRAYDELKASLTYQIFVDYYGQDDYADRWIQASFNGNATSLENGNADFSHFSLEGRTGEIYYSFVFFFPVH